MRREDCIRALQSPHSTSKAEAHPLKEEQSCTLTCLLSMYPGRSAAVRVSWMLTSLNETFLGGRHDILCFTVCTKGRPLGFTKHLDSHLRPPPFSQHIQNGNHCLYPKTYGWNSSQTFNVCMYVYYECVCMYMWSCSQVSKYSSPAWLHFIFSL